MVIDKKDQGKKKSGKVNVALLYSVLQVGHGKGWR